MKTVDSHYRSCIYREALRLNTESYSVADTSMVCNSGQDWTEGIDCAMTCPSDKWPALSIRLVIIIIIEICYQFSEHFFFTFN